MSEVPQTGGLGSNDSSHRPRIWQRDELLLILKSTGRCLPLEDMVKFVDFVETALPADRIIKFEGTYQISRQLEQMVKSELVEKKGSCYKTTEKGNRLADESELSMEYDEETDRIWVVVRRALANMPPSRITWDSFLNDVLKQLSESSRSPK